MKTVDDNNLAKYLILCPTMTIPCDVSNTRNAYYFIHAMLEKINLLKNVQTVLCPIPCTGFGQMDPKGVAKQVN